MTSFRMSHEIVPLCLGGMSHHIVPVGNEGVRMFVCEALIEREFHR